MRRKVVGRSLAGFVGAKAYFLLEQGTAVTLHDLGGTGFTWYGGLLGGVAAGVVLARRDALPLETVAGAVAAPLSVAYGIGRLGCFVSGDGTYGTPSSLPWAIAFPHGVVATDVRVHPTPLYEAVGAFVIAALVTPSIDPVTQTLVAAPIIVLYIIGIGLAFLVQPRRPRP